MNYNKLSAIADSKIKDSKMAFAVEHNDGYWDDKDFSKKYGYQYTTNIGNVYEYMVPEELQSKGKDEATKIVKKQVEDFGSKFLGLKSSDAGPKLNLAGALTGGIFESKPSKQQLAEVHNAMKDAVGKSDFLKVGSKRVKGSTYIAYAISFPEELEIPSSDVPITLQGTAEKDGVLYAYYRPESGGWSKAEAAEKLD